MSVPGNNLLASSLLLVTHLHQLNHAGGRFEVVALGRERKDTPAPKLFTLSLLRLLLLLLLLSLSLLLLLFTTLMMFMTVPMVMVANAINWKGDMEGAAGVSGGQSARKEGVSNFGYFTGSYSRIPVLASYCLMCS